MTYPLPMRNLTIEAESGVSGPNAYAGGDYPVAQDSVQQRQMEARGWEAVNTEAPAKPAKDNPSALLPKGRTAVSLDTTQEPPAVVVNEKE